MRRNLGRPKREYANIVNKSFARKRAILYIESRRRSRSRRLAGNVRFNDRKGVSERSVADR
ncbi:hypothetical protein ACFSR7_22105 [Cohnella sp. GCM10020058]|uniref:hypothetical protein n=1 Tax=Cohnella sp. GCM10020058 TaxID=3317330 RepID=UPI00362AC477